jgi:3-hydroxy-D-aspartate aldolase
MVPQVRHDIPTPALLLDLDAFEHNVRTMAGYIAARKRAFRPHGKTHKCPEIARRLIAAGAVGICAAKLGEAEVFAAAGIPNLLVTTAVVGPAKAARAAALALRAPDITFCADDADNVRELSRAAGNAGVTMNVAVDLYFGRTGIAPGMPALELAQLIDRLPNLKFAGLQAYDSSASHIADFAGRRARTRQSLARAVETQSLITDVGIACPFVSGASTGTYLVDAEIEGVTELQPGSFVFMDVDYSRIGGPDGPPSATFKHALTVITTVVSRHAATAIVDGGYKAFSTDRPFTPEPVALPGVSYAWAGDEHGRLDLSAAPREIRVGDRLEFIPPHCDPTVNLYDRIYVLREDRVEDVWPIAARGRSD